MQPLLFYQILCWLFDLSTTGNTFVYISVNISLYYVSCRWVMTYLYSPNVLYRNCDNIIPYIPLEVSVVFPINGTLVHWYIGTLVHWLIEKM